MEMINKEKKIEKKKSKEGLNSMVKCENFLPISGLRVLLVEADDSTRQIIGALLRKCNYKVATAPDGLKAWEVLKARPHNIDLILTEVELPSISGYALLTLIMEHQVCKNIPVIMMSKYDSMSLVYKCMMRGAADFLVKPIRINELKNLWQHVWRRQSGSRKGHGPQDESIAEEKLEATAENNATSDHSSGSKACARIRDDCLQKGSDAQSSCGKRDLEAESSSTAEVEDCSQPKHGFSPVNELRVHDRHNFEHSRLNLTVPETAAQDTAAYYGNRALDREQTLAQASHDKIVTRMMTCSPREAIDLIGSFDNHSNNNSCSHDQPNRYESSPYLDLSLTRCSPAAPENKSSNENQMLNHSNASAFTLYVNKTIQASNSNPTFDRIFKDNKVCFRDQFSDNSASEDPFLQYGRKVLSIPVNLIKEAENVHDNVSQKLFPIPLHNSRIQADGCSNPAGYGSPSPSPSSANPQISQNYSSADYSPKISTSQPVFAQDRQKLESLEDQTHFSTTGQCGPEGGNEQTRGLIRHRSLQREAALNKFRLKRKERCFDKKVRYESRKKLAEQRPRVKGQFVRQVLPDPPPPRSSHSGGISVAI
ncbi:hypothetical protein RND81_12G095200 [Saponaria officinalis]|uniref:Two-component response regulator-like APRR5 n=2 Tax=Saponaria officinalis TaxID=3572 RepID=A0AAW1H8I9_SAPOF